MSINIVWHDTNETIILQTFPEIASEEDVLEAARQTWEMIEHCAYPVDLIVDMREMSQHPDNLFGFWHKQIDPLVHPRQRFLVVVATSVFEQTWLLTAQKMGLEGARNLNICMNMLDARQRIMELRQAATLARF